MKLEEMISDINSGSGLLIFCPATCRFLLAKRSEYVNESNTWGTFGGLMKSNEDPLESAEREFREETQYFGKITITPEYLYKDQQNGFTYYTFIAYVPQEFNPRLNWENTDHIWTDKIHELENKHPGVVRTLQHDQENKNIIANLCNGARVKNAENYSKDKSVF